MPGSASTGYPKQRFLPKVRKKNTVLRKEKITEVKIENHKEETNVDISCFKSDRCYSVMGEILRWKIPQEHSPPPYG